MVFSKRFGSFDNWTSAQKKHNKYTIRVKRLHTLYPRASLEQLRGHASMKAKPKPLYDRSWSVLSSKERLVRERALEVLSSARKTHESLSGLAKKHGLAVKTVLRVTNGFRKARGRWKAKPTDHISRIMAINERGRGIFIEVRDSRQASLIGQYNAAVRQYLNTGNRKPLAKFKGKRVKDANGKFHVLETSPTAVRDIAEQREEAEFHEDIYSVKT